MRRIILTVIAGLAVTSAGHAEVNQSDSQTLQAILSELRQIRSELHDQQARNQTMQVLLFEMQTYQTAVNRATQRTDEAKLKLSETRDAERHFSTDISRGEDSLREVQDEADKKRIEADIERSKQALASFKIMEQDRIAVLQQAEAQLQKAEEGFESAQNQLGQLLKGLR
jgi:phage-related protein